MDFRRRKMSGGNVPFGLVFNEGICGIPCQRGRQFLRRMDEGPYERNDKLQ